MTKRPITYAPRGLRAEQAAIYLGLGRTKFLDMVDAGRLPKRQMIGGVRVWDRLKLDLAFDDFPDHGDDSKVAGRRNSFDEVLRGS